MIKNSIAKRLIQTIFAFYCIIAIAVTAMHVIQEYQYTETAIRKELVSYEKIFSPVLAQAMWDFDTDRILIILQSMQEVPVIKGVKIIPEGKDESDLVGIGNIKLVSGSVVSIDLSTHVVEQAKEYQVFSHEFVINYQYGGNSQALGTVNIYSSFDVVLDRVELGFFFLIFNAFIKSVALWLIIYWVCKKIIFKPLQTFTQKLNDVDFKSIDKNDFNQFSKDDYELYNLERSFSDLIDQLELERSAVKSLNKTLEDKVELRTNELNQQKLKAEKALNIKSDFLATMSHELRTPMNGVIGMLSILSTSDLDERSKNNVDFAKKSANNLLDLINDVLDISKIESGKLTFDIKEFNLFEEINLLISIQKTIAGAKGLDLRVQCDMPKGVIVKGDKIRLGQIINNLINNAVKFTQEGWIEVAFKIEDKGQKIELNGSVKDSGVGILPKDIGKLFGVFSQADTSTTRKFGGTGLGLSIVKGLCEEMGGSIWLDSPTGKGASFYFTVEFESSVAVLENENLITQAETENIQTLTTHQILLVEDNPINQMVAMDMLEDMNQYVQLAENGQQALDMLNGNECIEVILMDCQMPVMDGYTATESIRKGMAGSHYQSIPIIAVTANAMEGDKEKCLAAGMDAYLSKPINISELKSALIKHTDNP